MDSIDERIKALGAELRREAEEKKAALAMESGADMSSGSVQADHGGAASGDKITGSRARSASKNHQGSKKSTKITGMGSQNATKGAETVNKPFSESSLVNDRALPIAAYNEPLERVEGDILEPSPDNEISPEEYAGMTDAIHDFIHQYIFGDHGEMSPEEILKKEMRNNPQIWRALCGYVGREYFRKHEIFIDQEWKHTHGGDRYFPEKILAFSDIFLELCAIFGAMPFAKDYALFCGVSYNYIIGERSDGTALTSARVNLRQKFKQNQEIDLSRRLGHGVQNPTGAIFVLKNLHGWKDERTIEHKEGGAASISAAELPNIAQLLPDHE